jgi:hypothetical protein
VDVHVMVEVSGCPTTCMHCWALGRNYHPMPIEDAAFVLTELSRFCGQRGLEYATYPMHEVTAHPAAPEMIRLFAPHLGEAYDPILTPGTPLATRPEWAEVMTAAKECGAHALWVAFHGYGAEHDRQLNRPGAFEETCLAVRRAQECGLGTGANVFLTKPGLRDFDRLLAVLPDLRLGMFNITVAGFTPTARGRRYEAFRPDLADLLPIAQRVLDESCLLREQWGSLESHTEAAWVRHAQDGNWPATETAYCTNAYHQLVCRPNLDLHTGTTGIYRRRHGNLRRDGAQAVLERALADGPISQEQLYFPGPAPSIGDLAALGGDADSAAIHFDAGSVRYRWLDRLDAARNHGETASPRQGASATSSQVNSRRD